MRTRTGWLALLLTTGMALAPTMGWAQDPGPAPNFFLPPSTVRGQIGGVPDDHDVPRADPVFPLPLYHDRPENGGFFAAADFLYWRQTNPIGNQIIAIRGLVDADGSIVAALGGPGAIQVSPIQNFIPGAGGVGNFIGSGQPALNSNQAGGESYVPGWRVTMGYRFKEGFEVEVNYLNLLNARYVGGATLAPLNFQNGPLLADSFLYAPVWNFPPAYAGPLQKLAVGNPLAAYGIWNGASEMTIKFEQRYTEANIGGRVPIVEDECNRCYGLTGLRHAWIWERFKWRTVSYDSTGNADPSDAATYANIVSNPMYGPYIGVGNEYYIGHGFSVSFDVNAALMVDFVREIARWEREDFATVAKRSRREWTFVPEVEAALNIWWFPIEGVQIRAGYDFKAFFNTVSSPNPVAFEFNAVNPQWDHKAFRMIDGFHFGIGLIF
ncbi:MAG: hypothetical protein K2R98_22990 [Gemmataceae bacterium]|nr:hypothetical protein [Gemmataceae bacterium]